MVEGRDPGPSVTDAAARATVVGLGLFFLHIPKTAGSSVRECLRAAVDGRIVEGNTIPDIGGSSARTADLVMGHLRHDALDVIGPADVLTVLRDPAARIRSAFTHALAHRWQALGRSTAALGPHPTLADFITAHPQTHNMQVEMLAGVPGADDQTRVRLAIEHVESAHVLLADRLEESMALAQLRLGVPPTPVPVVNVSRAEVPPESDHDRAVLAFATHLDDQLLAAVRPRVEAELDAHAAEIDDHIRAMRAATLPRNAGLRRMTRVSRRYGRRLRYRMSPGV